MNHGLTIGVAMDILSTEALARVDRTGKAFFVFAELEFSELLVTALFRRGVPAVGIVAKFLSIRECPGVTFSCSGQITQLGQLELQHLPASMPEEHSFCGGAGASIGGGITFPTGGAAGGGWDGGVATQKPSFS